MLTGILNGIDTDAWDPETDPYIAKYYNATRLPVKLENKRALQEKLGLAVDEAVPLVGLIGRFTRSEGLRSGPGVRGRAGAHARCSWPSWARATRACRKDSSSSRARYPGKVGVHVGYDESMAHQIEAGADIFLMPSRFEPCGLNQMYSQRYGTPVVAHATGGLVDSIVDCTPETIADKTATRVPVLVNDAAGAAGGRNPCRARIRRQEALAPAAEERHGQGFQLGGERCAVCRALRFAGLPARAYCSTPEPQRRRGAENGRRGKRIQTSPIALNPTGFLCASAPLRFKA